MLKKLGVDVRSKSEIPPKRLYDVDDHYFDNIDCENKAYFLGILFADGNVRPDRPEISIGLQECDCELLEKLNRFIHKDRPLLYLNRDVKYPTWQNQYKLYISSRHMVNTVANYGLIPKKSLVKKFPEILLKSNDENIIRHFIRGYFDGNGSIGIYKSGDHGCIRMLFSISTSHDMCDDLKYIFDKFLNVKSYVKLKNNISSIHVYDQKSISIVLNWLYNSATIYLKRKYKIYKEFQNIHYKFVKIEK